MEEREKHIKIMITCTCTYSGSFGYDYTIGMCTGSLRTHVSMN